MQQRDTTLRRWLDERAKRLLDLTSRNPLIHARHRLEPLAPTPQEIWQLLVQDGEQLRAIGMATSEEEDDEAGGRPQDSWAAGRQPTMASRTGPVLVFEQPQKELERRLTEMTRRAKLTYDDAGFWTLYLAFGALEWSPSVTVSGSRSQSTWISPLVLVPIAVEREAPGQPFFVSIAEEEDIQLNQALSVYLTELEKIPLEDLEVSGEESVESILSQFEERVRIRGWSVRYRCWIGRFAFQKTAIYRDLQRNADRIVQHPVIQTLAGTKTPETFPLEDPRQLDTQYSPEDVATVLPADSSQLQAVLAARRGHTFVIQGPPGTGKSQTIVNIIADQLAQGKTVLFVSEKRAALDVVERRLEQVGLAPFCLNLHSHQAQRRAVLQSITDELDKHWILQGQTSSDMPQRVRHRRDQLRDYVHALHTPEEPLGQTPFEVIARLAALPQPTLFGKIKLKPQQLTRQDLVELRDEAAAFAEGIDLLREGSTFPWYGVQLDYPEAMLETAVLNASAALDDLVNRVRESSTQLGLVAPNDFVELRRFLEVLLAFEACPPFPQSWLQQAEVTQWADWAKTATACLQRLHEIEREHLPELDPMILSQQNVFAPSWNLRRLASQAEQLVELLSRQGPSLNRDDLIRIAEHVSVIRSLVQEVGRAAHDLSRALELRPPQTVRDLESLIRVAECLDGDLVLPVDWCRKAAQPILTKVRELARALRDEQRLREAIRGEWNEDLLPLAMNGAVLEWQRLWSARFRWARPAYWQCRKLLKKHYRGTQSFEEATPVLLEQLGQLLELRRQIERLSSPDEAGSLLQLVAPGVRNDPEALARLLAATEIVLSNTVEIGLLRILSRQQQAPDEAIQYAKELLEQWEPLHFLLEQLSLILPSSARIDEASAETLQDLLEAARRFADWWKEAEPFVANPLPLDRLPALLRQVAEMDELYNQLRDIEHKVSQSWAFVPERSVTTWHTLSEQLNVWRALCARLPRRTIPQALRAAALDPTLRPAADQLDGAVKECGQRLAQLAELFTEDPLRVKHRVSLAEVACFLTSGDDREFQRPVTFEMLTDLLGQLRERLPDVRRFRRACGARDELARELSLEIVQSLVTEKTLDARSIPDIVESIVLRHWLTWVMQERRPLSDFDKNRHEERRREFQSLDESLERWRVEQLVASLNDRRTDVFATHPAFALLKREANKRRRQRSLRSIFKEAFPLILRVKPCWLMSPLSVSHFLQSEHEFDVVIIDEASQVRPEEAIPALYRARQTIVCGDSKQLPPTRFFESAVLDMVEGNQKDEEEWTLDLGESVLEALEGRYPTIRLLWHYRSKDERLIAFSNVVFYGSSLITVPSPRDPERPTGIEYRLVNGTYRRGGTRPVKPNGGRRARRFHGDRINEEEIDEVCRLVEEHLQRWGTKRSLGVVTINEPQMNVLLDELERRTAERPALRDLWDTTKWPAGEEFFVKNLEAVQGDERDVIIVSTVYGRDEEGRFTLQLGPLTQAGGERRLNVLVTRAREQLILVTSLRPEDFRLEDEERQISLRIVRDYLRFARDSILPAPDPAQRHNLYESEFERIVADVIRSWGYHVLPQYGVGPYRIDLAIPDPQNPERVCIAVECDGATYHSLPTVRERDRLRQQWLERNGWTVIRVWSSDWWYHRQRAQEELRRQLEEAVARLHERTALAPFPSTKSRLIEITPQRFHPAEDLREILLQRGVVAVYGDSSHSSRRIPRIAHPDYPRSKRSINEIDERELRDLILVVVETLETVTREQLVSEIARLLGFQRTGSRIRERIEAALTSLLRRKSLQQDDGGRLRRTRTS